MDAFDAVGVGGGHDSRDLAADVPALDEVRGEAEALRAHERAHDDGDILQLEVAVQGRGGGEGIAWQRGDDDMVGQRGGVVRVAGFEDAQKRYKLQD